MATQKYEGKKLEAKAVNKIVGALTVEETLQVNIDNEGNTIGLF